MAKIITRNIEFPIWLISQRCPLLVSTNIFKGFWKQQENRSDPPEMIKKIHFKLHLQWSDQVFNLHSRYGTFKVFHLVWKCFLCEYVFSLKCTQDHHEEWVPSWIRNSWERILRILTGIDKAYRKTLKF